MNEKRVDRTVESTCCEWTVNDGRSLNRAAALSELFHRVSDRCSKGLREDNVMALNPPRDLPLKDGMASQVLAGGEF